MRHHFTLVSLTLLVGLSSASVGQQPGYRVTAIRYGTIDSFPVASLVRGADPSERLDIALVVWLIRGPERNILFDTGFHRDRWFERFNISDFMAPDDAVRLAGVEPSGITDIVVSHAHWDHMGGIDLFPNADIWIQRDEFLYYTGEAWQNRRGGGGSDPGDLLALVERNTQGKVRFVDGDDVEILPGIRAYTGARHTFASQFITIAANPRVLLASDNAYLYRNLSDKRPVATFVPADSLTNLRALDRMLELVGGIENIIPGHDPQQFERFPTNGRIAEIR